MSSTNYPRGPCAHSQCTQALGGCAAFVIVVNDTLREYALTADELCSACLHPWFSHRVGGVELQGRSALLLRGGCVTFQCGGFVMPAEGGPANWDTTCACGGPLRAHSILTSSASSASSIPNPQVAPVQFVTTHPAPSPMLPPGPNDSLDAAALASAPPIEAYSRLREDDAGSAWDRCRASAVRHRVDTSSQRSNVSRVRSSTSRVATPRPAGTPTGTLVHGEAPGPVASLEDPTVKVFSVLMIPFQHPATETRRGSYPRTEFVWTPEQFDKIVHQALLYKLVFTVTLAREGPVWLSFHDQVMAFCRRQRIDVPGYDLTVAPRSPSSLPFVLLKSANKKKPQGAKVHSLYDDLNCTSFTVNTLLATKFLITPPYPGAEEEFAPHPLLRIAPRRGDLSAHLMRPELWRADEPGMQDYLRITAPNDLHPCFPSRVMSVVGPDIVPKCRIDCPTERPRSPTRSPVAGPSGTQHAGSSSSHSPTSPSWSVELMNPPSPTVVASPAHSVVGSAAPSLSALQLSGLLDNDDFASATSTPLGSPTEVWRDLPARTPSAVADAPPSSTEVTHDSSSMDTVLPTDPPSDPQVDPASDIGGAPEPARQPASPLVPDQPEANRPSGAVPVVRYGRRSARSARMTTGGRPPAPVPRRGRSRRSRAAAEVEDDTDRDSPSAPRTLGDAALMNTNPTRRTSERLRAVAISDANPGTGTASPPARAPGYDVTGVGAAVAQVDSSVGAPPEGDEEERPTNRRRTQSPVSLGLPNLDARSPRPLRSLPDNAVKAWTTRVISMLAPEGDFSHPIPHIRAPNLEMAADILIFLVEWLIVKRPLGPSLVAEEEFGEAFRDRFRHQEAECTLTTLSRLMRHGAALDLRVGDAIGSSPLRSLLRLCVQRLVGDERYWKAVGRYRCVRPGPSGVVERETHLTLCGYFALLQMVSIHVGPLPISPMVLRYAIEGRDAALSFDSMFIRLIDPDLYDRLAPWDEYEWGTALPSDPSHPLITLIFSAGVDVKVFSDPPRHAELEWMERHLVAQSVFDGTELASDANGLRSFRQGMHIALAGGRTLDESFAYSCREYLAVMCSVRLNDISLLIRHIEFKSALDRRAAEQQSAHSEDMPDSSWDVIFEDAFKERVKAYLKGRGHPDHPDVRVVVGEDVFVRDRDDPLLRARLFLQMMSGSDLVPPNGDWKLKIYFRHVGRRGPLPEGASIGHIHPINVHACFYDCTVTVDEGVRYLLREDHTGLLFDVWFHGAVLDPHDYNQV
ncbi:hypothetical protein K466DRAFT_603805 [Polyporus arcularius HHB13444]|uniref:HECT domain-containing protein n=1 Tax=Polyporus arcularius HHB13444 TaxID=1314778 RepID=A0A5C3P0Z3_9APHY|nr:hypothetical protein K466DRAFT_603805 [Polyporus arcularius HHB13444]